MIKLTLSQEKFLRNLIDKGGTLISYDNRSLKVAEKLEEYGFLNLEKFGFKKPGFKVDKKNKKYLSFSKGKVLIDFEKQGDYYMICRGVWEVTLDFDPANKIAGLTQDFIKRRVFDKFKEGRF